MSEPASLPQATVERIARAIHQRYRQNQQGRKPATDPAMQPWEGLTEVLRDSSRVQAAEIPYTVARVNCRVAPLSNTALQAFSPDEVEVLARGEHIRWMNERRSAGWTFGPVRDIERKRTPYLVDWVDLPEEIREYDRDAVRALPDVLREAGLGLFLTDQPLD